MEEWRDIENYEGLYQISNLGQLKSAAKKWIAGNHNSNRMKNETLLIQHNDKYGYLSVRLYKNGESKIEKIHRLVAKSFIPNLENKPCINHINGIKSDNSIKNLEWCTYSENTIHSFKNNLQVSLKGQKHPMHKLTEIQIKEIRKKYIPKKYNTYILAKEYNMHQSTISDIVNYKIWKHI